MNAASKTNAPKTGTNALAAKPSATTATGTNAPAADGTNVAKSDKKSKEAVKQVEVVFVLEGDHAKMVPVKIGISDDNYWEITEGLERRAGGGFGRLQGHHRELEDGKKIRKGPASRREGQGAKNEKKE